MSKKDKEANVIGGLTYLPPKAFIWEKINREFSKEGVLLKKEKKGKKFSDKYVGVYFNYILWFKTGKGPNNAPSDKQVETKGVIELERVADESKIDFDPGNETVFVIPTPDEVYYFKTDNAEKTQEWIRFLRDNVSELPRTYQKMDWFRADQLELTHMRSLPKREPTEDAQKKIDQCQQVFHESTWKMPMAVPPENARKCIVTILDLLHVKDVEDLRKYREEYKKWIPFINSLALFAEFQSGRNKGYVSWFLNKSKGVLEQLNNSEDSVLDSWKEQLLKAPQKMEELMDTMFYMDDLQREVERYTKVYELIEIYNAVKREFHFDEAVYFQEEGEVIEAWLAKLNSFPYARDISMAEYTGGTITGEEDSWVYSKEELCLKWINKVGETVEFSCKDHEFTFIDPIYGSVAWNNRSWLWTHPRCPALIRYDYYPSKGVFKQKFPKIKPNIKGLQVIDAPPLSDWQLANGVIRAVTVGQRTPEPEVPPVTELTIEGNIPPPAALLAAIFYKIRDIMQELLGLKVFQPTGLNPIF